MKSCCCRASSDSRRWADHNHVPGAENATCSTWTPSRCSTERGLWCWLSLPSLCSVVSPSNYQREEMKSIKIQYPTQTEANIGNQNVWAIWNRKGLCIVMNVQCPDTLPIKLRLSSSGRHQMILQDLCNVPCLCKRSHKYFSILKYPRPALLCISY